MGKALLYVAGALAFVVAGLAVVVSMQPDVQHVERSIVVQATPADVFPYANDLKKFGEWNPWDAMDPGIQLTYSDNPAGVGAWYTWKGEVVGAGKMAITAVVPDQKVESDLDFTEPFASHADVTLSMTPEGTGTKVTWAFDSEQNFMSKAFGLVMDMDAMLGKDFESGLATLKTVTEKAAQERLAAELAAAEAAKAAEAAQLAADPVAAAPPAP